MEYVRYIQALIKEQKALGAIEEEVVSRYGHIPLIAPEAYNIYTFAPLTEEQLALVEQNIGRGISLANIEHFSPMLVMGYSYSIEGSFSTDTKEA